MPTENPKISAYVPKVVYEHFLKFKEERNLTFSQATITIFAEYFGINFADSSTSGSTGGLLDKVNHLEQQLSELKQFYVELSEKVENKWTTSRLADSDLPEELIQPVYSSVDESKSESGTLGIQDSVPPKISLPTNTSVESLGNPPDELPNDSSSGLLNELPIEEAIRRNLQLELIDSSTFKGDESIGESSSRLLNELRSNPVLGKILASRLGVNLPYLSKRKGNLSESKFYDWVASKDPDGIKWKSASGARGYIPEDDTPLELLQKLFVWLKQSTK